MAPPVAKPGGARVYIDPVSWPLIEETLDEADFLWRRRQRMLVAPDCDLRDLARLVEERLLGCIDGLRLGGDAAVARVLEPVLEEGNPRGCRWSRSPLRAPASARGAASAW